MNQNVALESVTHLRARGVFAFRYQFKPHRGPTVRAFCAHGLLIERLVLAGFEPHELEALWAATDLRCHPFPRTLEDAESGHLLAFSMYNGSLL